MLSASTSAPPMVRRSLGVTEMIRVATSEQHPVVHPLHPELTGPTIGPAHRGTAPP